MTGALSGGIELAGNRPQPLRAGEVWRIERGEVDLFAVTSEGDRTHLATFQGGDLLLGAARDERSHGLEWIALGRPGSRLQPLDPEGAAPAEMATQVDGWLSALAAGVAKPPDPRHVVELSAGDERDLETSETLRSTGEVLWLRMLEGRSIEEREAEYQDAAGHAGKEQESEGQGSECRETEPSRDEQPQGEAEEAAETHPTYLGQPENALPLGPDAPPVPLPPRFWIDTGGPVVLTAASTRELLQELLGELAPGTRSSTGTPWSELLPLLETFHQHILRRLRRHLDEREAEARRRLHQRVDVDQGTLRAAYTRLLSVLAPDAGAEVSAEEIRDPLLAACRRVGEHLGIEIRQPRPSARQRQSDRLRALADASRLRTRLVLLRGAWWTRDNGPLIAFRERGEGDDKTRHPVALLPTSARSYEVVDPVTGERRPMDDDLADELAGDAFMFYAPLPEHPLGLGDLVRAALRGSRKDLATLLLMGLGGGILGLVLPILTGQIFGVVIPSADRSQLLQMTLALVLAAFATASFQITRSIAVLRLSGRMEGGVQAAVWDRLLSLPISFFRRFTVGDLTNRSMGVEAIRELLTGNVLTSILAAGFSIFSFGLLFYYSPTLAVVATLLVGLLMAVTLGLTWIQLRYQRQVRHLEGSLASLLLGMIQGVAKLKVGGAEHRAFGRWADRFAEQRHASIQARKMAILQAAFNAVYSVLTLLVIFAVMGLSLELELSVGSFLAFNAAFTQFTAAALAMVGVLSSLLTMVPIYERLTPILQETPEVDDSKVDAGDLTGDVELNHVYFRYQEDGPLILQDVSFRARPGEFIALVGPSGSGKSTCLRLILGFEEPESGSIYFDGQDLSALSLQSVRRQIGVVLQSGRPMVGDIFSNIVGGSNLGIDDAWQAAEMAGLADDIRDMPMGMHTIISEGAGTFSGGQKQRLLIARALVHRPRILLFDEATSALDNRTQEVVSESLDRLQATRIVIAHRLSTIQNADRIYVIDAGRVVESGSYQELLEQGGVFTDLAERQLV